MSKFGSQDFGYALRVDFDLRPGGKPSALVPSQSELENHYGYHGEMWERLAAVRARAIVGPSQLNSQLLQFFKKFSYRKHLDYTLLDDLRALRLRIREECPLTKSNFFNLKLGRGGIRDIELFVHSLQVMHGGRNPSLQLHSTDKCFRPFR